MLFPCPGLTQSNSLPPMILNAGQDGGPIEVCPGSGAAMLASPPHGAGSALPGFLPLNSRFACPPMHCLPRVFRPVVSVPSPLSPSFALPSQIEMLKR